MPAPKNNTNAKKPAANKNTAILHLRCKKGDKTNWMGAAGRTPLARWVIETLNKKAPPL